MSERGMTLRVVLWTLGAVILVAAIGIGIWWFRVATADVKGKGDARIQIKSADSRITAYNHFFDLCAAIQGQEAGLDSQYEELSSTSGDDRERVLANIAGLSAERLRAIRQYNADARKSYTIGQFRASDLPYQIPAFPFKRGEATSCEA